METAHGKNVEYLDQRTGETVYSGPIVSVTQTVSETWCENCQKWIRNAGVLGPIRFMAFHDKADCVNDKEAVS